MSNYLDTILPNCLCTLTHHNSNSTALGEISKNVSEISFRLPSSRGGGPGYKYRIPCWGINAVDRERVGVDNIWANHGFDAVEQIHIVETLISTPTTRYWMNNPYEFSPIKR